MKSTGKSPLILFIPEAGIYPYLRGLAVLGDAVLKKGRDVLITRCTGQMLRCPMMAMHQLSADASAKDKKNICKICAKRFESAKKRYGFSIIELSDYVDETVLKNIDDLVSIAESNWKGINYKNFPVGKVAEYDFSLESKCVVYPNLSNEHRMLYADYIKNTALSIELGDKICRDYKPSLLIIFNPYAQCQAACHSAGKNRVSWTTLTYPTHYNVDASRFLIARSMSGHLIMKHIDQWNNGKDIPISPKDVDECWKDTIYRSYEAGSHIFSKQKTGDPEAIFKELELEPNRKTIIAYTCSYDEMAGLDSIMKVWKEKVNIINAFPDQISWLLMLQDLVKQRNDIQIIVRIHPREGGRQFGFGSQHLEQLKEKLSQKTPFFKVVWPDDPISSYDLMELADGCLVPWSNMGLETARVGIPVLAYTGNMFYPDDDFIQVATTQAEYKKRLDLMLSMQCTLQQLIKAVRFYHWRTFIPSLDLGETVPIDFNDDNIWPSAPESSIDVINDILQGKQDLIEYNIKQWHANLLADAVTCEAEAVRLGIRLFLDAMFYPPVESDQMPGILFRVCRRIWCVIKGKTLTYKQKTDKKFVDYRLEYSEDVSRLEEFKKATKKETNVRIVLKDGLYAILVHNGRLKKRMSPMVIRLAKLCCI